MLASLQSHASSFGSRAAVQFSRWGGGALLAYVGWVGLGAVALAEVALVGASARSGMVEALWTFLWLFAPLAVVLGALVALPRGTARGVRVAVGYLSVFGFAWACVMLGFAFGRDRERDLSASEWDFYAGASFAPFIVAFVLLAVVLGTGQALRSRREFDRQERVAAAQRAAADEW